MSVIRTVENIFFDGKSIYTGNGSHPTILMALKSGANILFSNCTPLWPTSEIIWGFNRTKLLDGCRTVPAFIHKDSRQGKCDPAEGNISESRILNWISQKIQDPADQKYCLKSSGKRVFYLRMTGGRQISTVLSLPRCRKMVGLQSPKRPHFLRDVAKFQ
ncbi:MAG: hypothetical protein R6U27_07455 [Desulfobacterales bacterium]